jgi:hypothetical protein
LVKRIAKENPLLGVPHIHGEMLKLGYEITESTGKRYMPKMNLLAASSEVSS